MTLLDPAGPPASLPLAGIGGAKALILLVIVALPAILILGTLLRRGRPR